MHLRSPFAFLVAFYACSPAPAPTTNTTANTDTNNETTTFAFKARVVGLSGQLVLADGTGNRFFVDSNGETTFARKVGPGEAFQVSVFQQPARQTCTLTGATGVASADVIVDVSCVTTSFIVSATVTGLAGDAVVLANGGEHRAVTEDGVVSFSPAAPGASYAVTVVSHPAQPSQRCSVQDGAGTIGSADVTNIVVTCANSFVLSGVTLGLQGAGLVLRNGTEDLEVSSDGVFFFTTPLAAGGSYAVTVVSQPTAPSQDCAVLNGSATNVSADVTQLQIVCTTNRYHVSGTITGLSGETLTLMLNHDETITAHAGTTSFAFSSSLASGEPFRVIVETQPTAATPAQTCLVANGEGTLTSADATNVQVTCSAASLYFVATAPSGPALFGTTGATGPVALQPIKQFSLIFSSPTELNDAFFFAASDGTAGVELWKSDGTQGGTAMLKDIEPGAGSGGSNRPLLRYKGFLLFVAGDSSTGLELWRTDGTAAGTTLVKDINPGASGSIPQKLTVVGDLVYFNADDGTHGVELWRTDGTTAGTVLVKDINPGAPNSVPGEFTPLGNLVLFAATSADEGSELWRTDGTEAGTKLVKPIRPGPNGSGPSALVAMDDTVFFAADDGTSGYELWRSNGTAGSTFIVKNINPGAAGLGVPAEIAVFNGALYFAATDGTPVGFELWKSDGTAGGTALLKDLAGAGGSSNPAGFAVRNGILYFRATDTSGTELWSSDGSAPGTNQVADINASAPSSTPFFFFAFNGMTFFSATTAASGSELWRTAPGGVAQVTEIGAGTTSAFPSSFVVR